MSLTPKHTLIHADRRTPVNIHSPANRPICVTLWWSALWALVAEQNRCLPVTHYCKHLHRLKNKWWSHKELLCSKTLHALKPIKNDTGISMLWLFVSIFDGTHSVSFCENCFFILFGKNPPSFNISKSFTPTSSVIVLNYKTFFYDSFNDVLKCAFELAMQIGNYCYMFDCK